ncbi:hypothetical protein [Bacillus rhizoplanae]|uniref:hypothetical protein n=1 Tax=Bacillus rhizoplanae TaxID=2880966 RepID=UPI003D207776
MYKVIVRNNFTGSEEEYGPYKTKEEAQQEARNAYQRLHRSYSKNGSMATFSTRVISANTTEQ